MKIDVRFFCYVYIEQDEGFAPVDVGEITESCFAGLC